MKITCSKCDQILELTRLYKQRYCKKCQAQYEHDRRKRFPANHIEKFKQAARIKANNMQYSGKIQKQPCSKCGNPNAEKHHDDYKKPLQFIWVCRSCHQLLHKNMRLESVPLES